jgi:hypothetical protein
MDLVYDCPIPESCNNPINVAYICQKYSNFQLIEDNCTPIQLEPIEICLNTFKYLFYETECFNINQCACNNSSLFPYISLLPANRNKIDGTPFSLVNEIYSNIEECLNITIEAIEPTSRIILNKEISSIKSLCQLHCQSLVNSLRWCDIINMVLSDPNYDPEKPLNLRITLVFVSSTQDVKNVIVVINYSITDFIL